MYNLVFPQKQKKKGKKEWKAVAFERIRDQCSKTKSPHVKLCCASDYSSHGVSLVVFSLYALPPLLHPQTTLFRELTGMKQKIYYFADFNLEALLSLSAQLRGRQCTCDEAMMPKCGSLNWVIFITFDDGIEWVFRSPMASFNHFYSDETASKIVESEASTLMYLKAHTSIPVPEVHSYR